MPYVEQSTRDKLGAPLINLTVRLLDIPPEKRAGAINYVFTKILREFYGRAYHGYRDHNEAEGILQMVGYEFYRRVCADYEDAKKEANGDVYDP